MNRDPAKLSDAEIKSIFVAEDNYRHAELLNDDIVWQADTDGKLIYLSERWKTLMGYTVEETTSMTKAIKHTEDKEALENAWRTSILKGESFDATARFMIKDTGEFRWLRVRANPRRDVDGQIIRWYGVAEDITDTVTLIDRQQTLLQELNHRVKNSLATVQSIVMQTFRSLRERDGYNIHAYQTFCDKVMERLLLLSSAHDLLTKNAWSGTDLGLLADHTLQALMTPNRYQASGPAIGLCPNASLLLAMVFHELGTNAIKYGAWSNDGGTVIIGWNVQDGFVELMWRERGGPVTTAPDHVGFGTKLITKTGLRELSGTTEMKFDPEGLTCYLRFAISDKVTIS